MNQLNSTNSGPHVHIKCEDLLRTHHTSVYHSSLPQYSGELARSSLPGPLSTCPLIKCFHCSHHWTCSVDTNEWSLPSPPPDSYSSCLTSCVCCVHSCPGVVKTVKAKETISHEAQFISLNNNLQATRLKFSPQLVLLATSGYFGYFSYTSQAQNWTARGIL